MSKKPNDGGPAFPFTGCGEDGMTLRDKFADSVLPAVYAEFFAGVRANEYNLPSGWKDGITQDCYDIADAMIAVRSNGSDETSDGHIACLENQVEMTKKLNDTRAALVSLIEAQRPVSNTAFNLGQDSNHWKLINSNIDALDAAVAAAREVLK